MAYNTAAAAITSLSETIREDLSAFVTIMTPADIPLMSSIGWGTCSNTHFEWSIDELATPTAVASEIQGAEATFPTLAAPQRIGNVTNIVEKAFSVADTTRVVNEAPFEDTYNYHGWKTMVEVLKQSELNAHFGQVGATLPAASTAVQTHGVLSWIIQTGAAKTNGDDALIAGHTVPTQYGSVTADGGASTGALTRENFVTTLLEDCWDNGMQINQSMLFCGGPIKRILSTFGHVYASGPSAATEQVNNRSISASAKRIIDTIDIYESDFGAIAFNLDRYMNNSVTKAMSQQSSTAGTTVADLTLVPNSTLFIIEPGMWEVAVLRGLSHVPLAKIGDASNGQIITEWGIKCYNPLAGGALYNAFA